MQVNGRAVPAFWNHMNSIAYNATLDQIVLSVRGCNEIWTLDHSTTLAEAAGHSGGRHGRGGDLIYRSGNPAACGRGTARDKQLIQQHDAEWIPDGCPGAGHLTIFVTLQPSEAAASGKGGREPVRTWCFRASTSVFSGSWPRSLSVR